MMGQWALYDEGWLLSTKVNRAPWEAFGPANPDPLNNQVLELYDLNTDYSQSQNIADKYPDKVKEMKEEFIEQAEKYGVFPMDASVAARIVAPRPNITAGRTEFVYTHPMVGLPQGDSPSILNSSYTFTAEIEVPEGGAEGMIVTSGGRFGGYGFYLLKGKPVFLWNLVDLKRPKWEGPDALTPGKHTIAFDFKYDGLGVGTLAFNNMSGLGRSGTGTLSVDGKVVDYPEDGQDDPDDPAVGRELRRRLRHADRRQRRRLPAAVRADRQARQADAQDRPAGPLRGRHQEADRRAGRRNRRGGGPDNGDRRPAGQDGAARAAIGPNKCGLCEPIARIGDRGGSGGTAPHEFIS